MSLEFRIALTHLLGRKRQTVMSLLGVLLGVAFFLAVSSLMRGSEQDFITRLVDSAPHITVMDEFRTAPRQPAVEAYAEGAVSLSGLKPRDDTRGIRGYKQKLEYLQSLPNSRVAAVLSGQAILTSAGKQHGVTVNGIEPDQLVQVSNIEDKIVAGSLDELTVNTNGIVIGRRLAEKLYLAMGDSITVTSSVGLVKTMKIVGLFDTGTTAIDEGQAYVLLKRAQVLLGRPDRANKLILQIDSPYAARDVAATIEGRIGYRTQSWQETSEDLLAVLLVRNVIMYSVVSAILIVAAFGIFNVISTVVMEKQRDIAILRSIGFPARDIRRIFLTEGLLLGGVGSLIGVGFGTLLMLLLERVAIRPPGLSEAAPLPVDWGLDQVLLAALFAVASAVGASYLPARKAGNVRPVDILRGGMA